MTFTMVTKLGKKPIPVRLQLKTPSLRFEQVEADSSALLPIVVSGAPDQLLRLEVVVPPLAPFSIAEPSRSQSRRRDDPSGARIWIRYDARSSTSWDTGEVIVRATGTERCWSIPLLGSGELAREI